MDRRDAGSGRRWRITAIVAAACLVITAICYILLLLRVPGMHFVIYLAPALFALLIIYLALWSLCSSARYRKHAAVIKRCYLLSLFVAAAAFTALEVVIISGARSDGVPADCMIILGAGLNGERPTAVLASRLNAAIAYLEEHGDMPVIVSGGQGPGETITEAEAMYRYLRDRGVDESLIRKEEASTSTYENFAFSAAILEQMGLDVKNTKAAIVTNEFHMCRSKLIAERAGLNVTGVAAETYGSALRVVYFCREGLALAWLLLTGS